jgi:TPR repeat protein
MTEDERLKDALTRYEAGETEAATGLIEDLAEEGHAQSQFTLYHLFASDPDDEGNLLRALFWLRAAAHQVHPQALYLLGVACSQGFGVAEDQRLARIWWERAANAGHAYSMFTLGHLHEAGDGVPADLSKAMAWYENAARAGLSAACDNLAALHLNGEKLEKDVGRGLFWLKLASMAPHGDPEQRSRHAAQWREIRGRFPEQEIARVEASAGDFASRNWPARSE